MNKNVTFIVDSGSDMSPELIAYLDYPVRIVPLNIHINGEDYLDGVTITNERFYQKMRESKDLPKTSQPSPHQFYEVFQEELEKGNQVLYIGITSKLSGTFQSAVIAREMFSEEDKDKIFLIDSLNVSGAIYYLLLKAQDILYSKNLEESLDEINHFKTKIKFVALLDTLENLKKGGRVSMAQATIGGLLNIKPLISIQDGLVETLEKFRGRKKGMNYIQQFLNNQGIDRKELLVIHSLDEDTIKEELKSLDLGIFHKITYLKLGSTLGTHAGEHAIGFIYIEQ